MLLVYILTLFPIRKCDSKWITTNNKSDHDQDTSKQVSETWQDYVSKSASHFDLFATYLVEEFAVENLLFIYEISRFKQFLMQFWIIANNLSKNNNIINNCSQFGKIYNCFPKGIAQSSIDKHITKDMKNKIMKDKNILFLTKCVNQELTYFYKKYIEQGKAPLEINISHTMRNQIKTSIAEITHKLNVTQLKFENAGNNTHNNNSNNNSRQQRKTLVLVNDDSQNSNNNNNNNIYTIELVKDLPLISKLFDKATIELSDLVSQSFVRFQTKIKNHHTKTGNHVPMAALRLGI